MEEKVWMEDYYFWKAEYFDGTVIPQIKADGSATKWDELDFSKIKYWVLEPKNSLYKRIVVDLNGKLRPIFWRNVIRSAVGGNFGIICYKFGWQDTINNSNIKVINYIYPNGDIEQIVNDDEPKLLNAFLSAVKNHLLTNGNN